MTDSSLTYLYIYIYIHTHTTTTHIHTSYIHLHGFVEVVASLLSQPPSCSLHHFPLLSIYIYIYISFCESSSASNRSAFFPYNGDELSARGEAQVRQARVPLPDLERPLPPPPAAGRRDLRAPLDRLGRRRAPPVGPPQVQPRRRRPLLLARGLRGDRLPDVAAPAGVPPRLLVLQARGREEVLPGALHGLLGEGGDLHRGEPRVPEEDHRAVRARAVHLLPRGRDPAAAQPLHGRGEEGGRDGHVRGHRRPPRQDRGEGQGRRDPRRQLQPLQPDAVPLRHDRQPLQAQGQYRQLQPRRHGLQCGAHLHRPCQEAPSGSPKLVCVGCEHGEHHPELVLGEQPVDARLQLPLPHGRRGDPPHQPPLRPGPLQVPARPHRPHPQGRGRPLLQLRVPGGGRRRQGRRRALQGAHGGGGGDPQGQHHHPRAARPPALGAAPLLRDAGRAQGPQDEGQAVHPGLQAGVRALLHPRGGPCRARRAREAPRAQRVAHGALEDDAEPVREHVEQLAVVRARLHGGQREGEEGGPGVADRVRVGVQVQQRRLESDEDDRSEEGEEPMDGRDRPVPRPCSQSRGASNMRRRRRRRRLACC